MSAALGLYRLQQVDSRIDEIQARQKRIEDTLQNDISLRTATQAFSTAESRYNDSARLLKTAEAEVEKQRLKIEQTSATLYGGGVRNPKELQDLEKDIVSLKKHLETLEERELELMLATETLEQALQVARLELERIQAQVLEQNRDLSREQASLLHNLEQLEAERKATLNNILAAQLGIYDQIRKQRRGVAVAAISDDACAACGTTLTASLQQSARSASQLCNCPTCGRILYAN
jgi:uncharacterized protein